jgi:hypothetical protein
MKNLTRGEHKLKKILFHHARDYGKKGLGSFLEVSKSKIYSPEIGLSFVKKVDSYCQHCHVTGHHNRECHLSNIPLPIIPKKGHVKVRFISKLTKNDRKKLPKQLWVPKVPITHV